MTAGRLIGVGVGPGDPELLTLKAIRLLERVPVVTYITAEGRPSRARAIAGPFIGAGAREIGITIAMGEGPRVADAAYRELADAVRCQLVDGRDVAFLCEGDPLLYGSFAHLCTHLGDDIAIAAIPGITSISAAAAACLRPLALRERTLTIVPATLPPERLMPALEQAEAVVILKVGQRLAQVRAALRQTGLADDAVLVENVTTAGQRIRPLADVPEDRAPYFSLVLAGRADGRL